jgi:hypothetical protein
MNVSDSDLQGNQSNSARPSHGHKAKIAAEGAGREESKVLFCQFFLFLLLM